MTVALEFDPRYELDTKAQALYVQLSDKPCVWTYDLNESCHIDYAADGTVIGVEVIGVLWRD